MGRFEFEDRLEVIGILAGAFLIVAALGTLSGTPWTTNEDTLAVVIQLLGIVVTLILGVALILVAYREEPGELLPIAR